MVMLSISDLQTYAPIITMAGGLGYAIYQNDGQITTGLIMSTLNPTGEILKSQEYEIGLLKTMEGMLADVDNRLQIIDGKLNNLLLEFHLSTDKIIAAAIDPRQYIDSIYYYESELFNLGGGADPEGFVKPHTANQDQLDQLANAVLAFNLDSVNSQINQIQGVITGTNSSGDPLLEVFTDALITKLHTSSDINRYDNAYQALESYTMKLVNAEVRGTNLVVDASLYQADRAATENGKDSYRRQAAAANTTLKHNLREILSWKKYGFLYNTMWLMLSQADPYYDAPGYEGHFLPPAASDIIKRADFLQRRLINEPPNSVTVIDNPYAPGGKVYQYHGVTVVVYYVTEVGEPVPEPTLGTLDGRMARWQPDKTTTYQVTGRGYDSWQGSKMKYSNQYQATVYEFQVEGAGNYYVYGEGINSQAIEARPYNARMQPDPEGEILYGFALLTKRDSHRFEQLQWQECLSDEDHRYRSGDSLMAAIDAGNSQDYLKNPLANGVWIKAHCDEWNDHHDCIIYSSENPCNDLSLCTYFTYDGNDTRHATMSIKLYRYMNMDAEIAKKTDGEVKGKIKLYVYDQDEEKTYELYENKYQTIQGWHYKYDDTSIFTGDLKLVPGHRYRVRIHLRASIDQGLMNTAGYFKLKLVAREPLRFFFNQ
ncbi:MAG: hypothetical protein JRJ56_06060 [Deltaproteobacteria bacterium]|nr:hypothetical protein [Deltaproteobacteria bacterium]